MSDELVILERGVSRSAEDTELELAALALTPWSVELVDGQIAVGGNQVHPVIARELWLRLGTLLGQAVRDADQPLWDALGRALDREFRGAYPCRGRMDGAFVDGMMLRDGEDRACLRLSMFSIAMLKRQKRGWEGLAFEVRPLTIGRELRPLGFRVHVADKLVRPMPKALPGPVVSAPARRDAPGLPPRAPTWLLERRATVKAELAVLLDAVGPVGAVATLDAIAAVRKLPREVLREQLEQLVEQGELAVSKADGPWTRQARPTTRAALRAEKLPKGQRTRLVRPAKAKPAAAAVKAVRKTVKPKLETVKPMRCAACDRDVDVPLGVAAPRCRVCKGLLSSPTD